MIRKLSDGRYEWTRKIRRRGSLQDLRRLERRVEDALDLVGRHAEPRDVTIAEAIDRYLASAADNDLARETIAQYRSSLMEMHDLLCGRTLGELAVGDIEALRHELRRRNSAATVNRKISLLKRFARWAARVLLWAGDPRMIDWLALPALRARRDKKRVLGIRELLQVIDALPEHIGEILRLSLLTVARPKAVLSASWADVIWPDEEVPGVIRFPTLKRGVDGAVMFFGGSEIEACLLRSREIWRSCRAAAGRPPRYPRATKPRDPLYITRRRGEAWTVSALDREVKRHLERAGIHGVTPYTIRRSIITAAWHLGGSAGEVQAVAKHRAFRTTEHYIIEQANAVALRQRLEAEIREARAGG